MIYRGASSSVAIRGTYLYRYAPLWPSKAIAGASSGVAIRGTYLYRAIQDRLYSEYNSAVRAGRFLVAVVIVVVVIATTDTTSIYNYCFNVTYFQ